ncbi:MAG TPA: RluA family pseudouridine synthase, partial [Clostridiaceae bacterium]|nr:RluA family pseudouridine synthase [Clostridiaceae bacterium]
MEKIIITANEANQRLDRFLRKYLKNVPLSGIYEIIRKKRVKVNGKGKPSNYRLNEGDMVELFFEGKMDASDGIRKSGMDFTVLYEDGNIMAVDKPAGLITHPDKNHKDNTLTDQVLYYLYGKNEYSPENEITFRPAAVNRLDINTGGIVLFAKNYLSLQNLNMMIRERYINKYYLCIVKGILKGEQDIEAYL